MLVPAMVVRDELTKLFAEKIYSEDMFWYNGYSFCNTLPDLEARENFFKWAIVDDGQVVGYLTYMVEGGYSVKWFGLISFKNSPVIGIDLYFKLKELINTFHRLEWRMISGNPVQKHYDKFCERFGGNKVVLHDVVKDGKGFFHDEYVYEIINHNDEVKRR